MSLVAHYSSPSSTNSQTKMSLSNNTVSKLADVLKADIIDEIYNSEKYFDMMTELVGEALEKKLGKCDEMLFFDIGMCLMDRIELK